MKTASTENGSSKVNYAEIYELVTDDLSWESGCGMCVFGDERCFSKNHVSKSPDFRESMPVCTDRNHYYRSIENA